ncbi:ras-like GTP-binding protein RhoL [Scaptodrosophila lebanonensis]|uniref:Ras-like GTP-binding protein RhoL n=1 Tax=Drosophila lebanonensis TaxID=7225 RepID=A0A6J2TC77_DROLE|nr:ras-like GTP-binding protein RhoL [Scaptodrosophila lebanonensis]
MAAPDPYKIVIVGDGYVGKTCLLLSHITNEFPGGYAPTIFENYSCQIEVDFKEYTLLLWDTSGQEIYSCIRTLCYPNTKCFIVCYAIDNRRSFENVRHKWVPEIRELTQSNNVSILVVAAKSDLRANNATECVTTMEGISLCKEIKADCFVECSARSKRSNSVFVQAIRIIKRKECRKSSRCQIL